MDDQFWLVIVGMFVFFIANPFILNSISIIANLWFPDHQRARSTAISALMPSIGSILGLGMAGVLAMGVTTDSS